MEPHSNTEVDRATTGAMSVEQFTKRYGLKRSKFYLEREAGKIRVKKIGKTILIPVEEAERWLASYAYDAAVA